MDRDFLCSHERQAVVRVGEAEAKNLTILLVVGLVRFALVSQTVRLLLIPLFLLFLPLQRVAYLHGNVLCMAERPDTAVDRSDRILLELPEYGILLQELVLHGLSEVRKQVEWALNRT